MQPRTEVTVTSHQNCVASNKPCPIIEAEGGPQGPDCVWTLLLRIRLWSSYRRAEVNWQLFKVMQLSSLRVDVKLWSEHLKGPKNLPLVESQTQQTSNPSLSEGEGGVVTFPAVAALLFVHVQNLHTSYRVT